MRFTTIPGFQIILIDALTLHIGLEIVQSLTLYELSLLPASALILVPKLGAHVADETKGVILLRRSQFEWRLLGVQPPS